VQARFEGSDRQVRGLVMRELRTAHRAVAPHELDPLWSDATQLERAIAGLVADGLAVLDDDGALALPDA
jgi:A/G-specific adenine glycosylase